MRTVLHANPLQEDLYFKVILHTEDDPETALMNFNVDLDTRTSEIFLSTEEELPADNYEDMDNLFKSLKADQYGVITYIKCNGLMLSKV